MAELNKPLDTELPDLGAQAPSHQHRDAPVRAFEQDEVEEDFPIVFAAAPPPANVVSPERVRFAAPAVLSFDGYEETFDVCILNLSEHGVACTGPQGLAAHDRLRLQFRLHLAAAVQSFLCEVIWLQNGAKEDATYGLRFLNLDEDVATQVRDAVRERVEGRAGEWPMPILPPPPAPPAAVAAPAKAPRFNALLAAVGGMAAGVLVTLGLAAAFTAGAPEGPLAAEPAISSTIDTPEVRPGASDVMPLAPVLPPPAPAPPPPVAVAAPAASPPSGILPPPPRPVSAPARVRKIGLLKVEEGTDQVSLTLLADGPVAQHATFWLQNPQRLVVDIPGRQSGFQSKLFEVGHPLVTRLRVGQHPGKVRFVIETGGNVAPNVVAKEQGSGVRVELRRKSSLESTGKST